MKLLIKKPLFPVTIVIETSEELKLFRDNAVLFNKFISATLERRADNSVADVLISASLGFETYDD